MRLIDADKLKEELSYKSPAPDFDIDSVILGVIDEQPTDSPWHRVEEPPKPHKDVLVTGIEAINNHRVYKVMVNDNGTWRPTDYAPSIRWDYWMPIEPPKEEV